MRNVYINDIDLYNEYGLIPTHRELTSPTPRTYTTEIVGKDGVLDYTSFYGELTYSNRTITITLIRVYNSLTNYTSLDLENKFNGKEVKVMFDDDLDYYWKGRATITTNTDDMKTQNITISIDAHPFKYSVLDDSEVRDV